MGSEDDGRVRRLSASRAKKMGLPPWHRGGASHGDGYVDLALEKQGYRRCDKGFWSTFDSGVRSSSRPCDDDAANAAEASGGGNGSLPLVSTGGAAAAAVPPPPPLPRKHEDSAAAVAAAATAAARAQAQQAAAVVLPEKELPIDLGAPRPVHPHSADPLADSCSLATLLHAVGRGAPGSRGGGGNRRGSHQLLSAPVPPELRHCAAFFVGTRVGGGGGGGGGGGRRRVAPGRDGAPPPPQHLLLRPQPPAGGRRDGGAGAAVVPRVVFVRRRGAEAAAAAAAAEVGASGDSAAAASAAGRRERPAAALTRKATTLSLAEFAELEQHFLRFTQGRHHVSVAELEAAEAGLTATGARVRGAAYAHALRQALRQTASPFLASVGASGGGVSGAEASPYLCVIDVVRLLFPRVPQDRVCHCFAQASTFDRAASLELQYPQPVVQEMRGIYGLCLNGGVGAGELLSDSDSLRTAETFEQFAAGLKSSYRPWSYAFASGEA